MTPSETWQQRAIALGATVPIDVVTVSSAMREHGMVTAREVVVGRATMVVTEWADGMTIVGSFCGAGSPQVAREKALQRALEQGLRLKARWAAQRSEG